ncbi:MAG: FG-GAP repeat protein [Chitinophagaceae bacterium]
MSKKILSVACHMIIMVTMMTFFLAGCKSKDKATEPEVTEAVFKKVPSSQSGITFSNVVEENYIKNNYDKFAYVYNGAGVATGDINNDGLPDIYFGAMMCLINSI